MAVWVVLEFELPKYCECEEAFRGGLIFETERAAEAYLVGKGYDVFNRKEQHYVGVSGMVAKIEKAPIMTDQETTRLLLEGSIGTDQETKESIQIAIEWLKKGEKE